MNYGAPLKTIMSPAHRSFADPCGKINDMKRKPCENSSLGKNPLKYTTASVHNCEQMDEHPGDARSGPTKSTWMWVNLHIGTSLCCGSTVLGGGFWPTGSAAGLYPGGDVVKESSPDMLEAMTQWVCRWSKTCLRRSLGTRGQNIPMVVSPWRSRSPTNLSE